MGQDHEYGVLEQRIAHWGNVGTGVGFRSNLHGSQMPNHFVNCQETEERESLKLAGTGR